MFQSHLRSMAFVFVAVSASACATFALNQQHDDMKEQLIAGNDQESSPMANGIAGNRADVRSHDIMKKQWKLYFQFMSDVGAGNSQEDSDALSELEQKVNDAIAKWNERLKNNISVGDPVSRLEEFLGRGKNDRRIPRSAGPRQLLRCFLGGGIRQ